MNGAERIAKERQRQIEVEGWTEEHDDRHAAGEMGVAGSCYLGAASLMEREPMAAVLSMDEWPWDQESWKPGSCPERCLEKAGALFLAEAARLVRQGSPADQSEIERLTSVAGDCGHRIDTLFAKRLARVKIIRLNDSEWWMGYSIEEAIAHYLEEIHDIKIEAPLTLARLGNAGEDFLDTPKELSEEDLDSYRVWNSEDGDIKDPANWTCECGSVADRSDAFRWNGSRFEHDHLEDGSLRRVAMTSPYLLTFREALVEFLSKGDPVPGMFWAIDP